MKFSEIPYERGNVEALKAELAAITERFRAAETWDAADRAFVAMNEVQGRLLTMSQVAHVRRDIDTRDPFYDGEVAFYNRALPELQPLRQAWTRATLESPFRKQLEEKYGGVSFLNGEINLKTFSPEIIPELQEENELVCAYTKLLASAQIPFAGSVYTLAQLGPYKLDPDDQTRLAAWTAEGRWYNENGEALDLLYDQLVKLRDRMSRKLGYDSYIQLGYYRMERNCYDQADVERFRAAVRTYLVPVADQIYRQQAQRLGKAYPMNFADNALEFRSGNPRPAGDPAAILEQGTKFYTELSPETEEFWRFMREHEMMDVLSRTGKAGGGYCTCLYDYRAPFIFANFNGTSHDVEVITHEAGHAFAGYVNRDRIPADTIWPSLEGCEVHSKSMEFFAWPWAEGFFGPDARKYRYTHLSGALTFIPYGTMVDHFQHLVYEKPEMTPAQRHEAWKELLGIYMPWMKLGEIPFYGEGKGWQRQSHIYKTPFYYIDYCLAQTVALELWVKLQQDPKAAFQTYLAYTKLGGSMVFTDLLRASGLDSPFDETCLRTVCQAAQAFLEAYDLSGLL